MARTSSHKTSPQQKRIVARVMHDFKDGALEQRNGEPVTDAKQAIAIALHEAGSSNRETPARNRANLNRTLRGERQARREATRADLYEEARRRDIPGRSRMSKAELQRALA